MDLSFLYTEKKNLKFVLSQMGGKECLGRERSTGEKLGVKYYWVNSY